jgi:hypothetical protein
MHTGLLELVGKNEQVDQNELGAAVSATFAASVELTRFTFYATEEGTGAIQDSAGDLLIFTADPGHSVGDNGSGVSAAEGQTCVGVVTVTASDWVVLDNIGIADIKDQLIQLEGAGDLYFVWSHTDI